MVEYCAHHVVARHSAIHQTPYATSHYTHSSHCQEELIIPTPEAAERHRLIRSLQRSIAPIQKTRIHGLVTTLDHAKSAHSITK